MAGEWGSGKRDAACEKCGSTYLVEYYQVPAKEKESFTCEVCAHLMYDMKTTDTSTFTLKERKENHLQ